MKKLTILFSFFVSVSLYAQDNALNQTIVAQLPIFLKNLEGNWVGSTGRELWTPVEDEAVIEGISFYNVNFEDYGTNEIL